MLAEKIIKIYFVFVMGIVATGMLGYSDALNSTQAALIFFGGKLDNDDPALLNYAVKKNDSANTRSGKQNLVLTVSNNPDARFGAAGSENQEIQKYEFKSFQGVMNLDYLAISVVGINPEQIVAVKLADNQNEILAQGELQKNKFVFENINFNFTDDQNGEIRILADLADELKSGERLRLDIDSPQDIMINGQTGDIYFENFPVKGKYFSIVKFRWVKKATEDVPDLGPVNMP